MANIMSPGEATYLIMVNFMAGQVMTRDVELVEPARSTSCMTAIFAEYDQAKLKPLYGS